MCFCNWPDSNHPFIPCNGSAHDQKSTDTNHLQFSIPRAQHHTCLLNEKNTHQDWRDCTVARNFPRLKHGTPHITASLSRTHGIIYIHPLKLKSSRRVPVDGRVELASNATTDQSEGFGAFRGREALLLDSPLPASPTCFGNSGGHPNSSSK